MEEDREALCIRENRTEVEAYGSRPGCFILEGKSQDKFDIDLSLM